ncbi:hypothetical protein ES703_71307 [subsurface metagenome]
MRQTAEGPAWVDYELLAVRPTQAMAERELGLITERAVANFLARHFPRYRRKDITDLVIDTEPVRGGLIKYKVKVSFTDVEREQI